MKYSLKENLSEYTSEIDHGIRKTINDGKVDTNKFKKKEMNKEKKGYLYNYKYLPHNDIIKENEEDAVSNPFFFDEKNKISKTNVINNITGNHITRKNDHKCNEEMNQGIGDNIYKEEDNSYRCSNGDSYESSNDNDHNSGNGYGDRDDLGDKEKKPLKEFNIFIDKKNAVNSIISSTFAGIMSRTITAPLDRVKYIMQVTNNLPIAEIFEIIKKDGVVCGFFRGNCVNIVKIIPELSIKMYSYEFMKMNVYNYYNKNNNCMTDDQNMNIPFFIRFLIGSSSGVIAALFIYPLEIVKTRLIVSNKNNKDNGIIKCFYNIYKNEKWRNFYNGLSMHIYGVIFFSGCNMSIYDYLKYLFFSLYRDYIHSNYCVNCGHAENKNIPACTNIADDGVPQRRNANDSIAHPYNSKDGNSQSSYDTRKDGRLIYDPLKSVKRFINFKKNYTNTNNLGQSSNEQNENKNNMNMSSCSYCNYRIKNVNCLSFLFFGITSSFIAQIVSYPFLVLRTRMQTLNNEIATNYLNSEGTRIKSCSFIMYNIKVYGFKSLYRGIYVNLLKTIPATSITWFAYEYSMRKLQS
ncbi:mitochondrial carrier protein [Plasmodium brasilianum]|uniref:Transporter n=2 Tax=Plasmodium (Plasmodium) TaxID=418103 RepID=A0A1A8VXR3_PLAMA|nr:transporter, putative [Plasmodium malariae]KAI4839331.1 mitochondrial carrier protein [Plasmodium brasilianum]SBS83639.1 transporter [Plasmodium malariae]SBT87743.1 transporter, putative [Plasmodium malariae]